jgi:hypothetical protein
MPRAKESGYEWREGSESRPEIAKINETANEAAIIDGIIVIVDWSPIVVDAHTRPIDLTGATEGQDEGLDQELLRMLQKQEFLSVEGAVKVLSQRRPECAELKKEEVGDALARARQVMHTAEDSCSHITIQVRRLAREDFYFKVQQSSATLETVIQQCVSRANSMASILGEPLETCFVFCVGDDHTFIATRKMCGPSANTADGSFIGAATFDGTKQGYVFTTGEHGSGYYRDQSSESSKSSKSSDEQPPADDFLIESKSSGCDSCAMRRSSAAASAAVFSSLGNFDHFDMYSEYEYNQMAEWNQNYDTLLEQGTKRPLADYVIAGHKSNRIYFGLELSTSDAAVPRGPLRTDRTVSDWEVYFEADRLRHHKETQAKQVQCAMNRIEEARKSGLKAYEDERRNLYFGMMDEGSNTEFVKQLVQNHMYEDVVFLAGMPGSEIPGRCKLFRCLFETTMRYRPKLLTRLATAAEAAGSGEAFATIWIDLVKLAGSVDAMAEFILAFRPAQYSNVLGRTLSEFFVAIASDSLSSIGNSKVRSRCIEAVKSLLGDGAKPSYHLQKGTTLFAWAWATGLNLEKGLKEKWRHLCTLLIPHLNFGAEFKTAISSADKQTLQALFEYNPAPAAALPLFFPSHGAYVAVRMRNTDSSGKKVVTRYGRIEEVRQVKRKKKKKKKTKNRQHQQGFDAAVITSVDCHFGAGDLVSVRDDGCCVVRLVEGGATAYLTGDGAQTIKAVNCGFGAGELVDLRDDGCCTVRLLNGGTMAYLGKAPESTSSAAVVAAVEVVADTMDTLFQVVSYDEEARLHVSSTVQQNELTSDDRCSIWHESAKTFALKQHWVLLAEILKRLPQLTVPPNTPLETLIGSSSADQPHQYSSEYHLAAKAEVLLPCLLERGAHPNSEVFKASVAANKMEIAELLAKYHPPVADVPLTEAVRHCETADRLKKWVTVWRRALQISEREALPASCVGGEGVDFDGQSPLHAAVATKCGGIIKVGQYEM